MPLRSCSQDRGRSVLDDASSGGLRADQTDSSELLARLAKAAIAREEPERQSVDILADVEAALAVRSSSKPTRAFICEDFLASVDAAWGGGGVNDDERIPRIGLRVPR